MKATTVGTPEMQVDRALQIVGAEDLSDDGVSGVVTVDGLFAAEVIAAMVSDPDARKRLGLDGQPVRISRMGGLEIWCNGFYMEGKGVRSVIHRAARALPH
ncbi:MULTISPECIES: hypothetical protein [Pandoraea]|uniref:hypothetical protein n=1 Tax=Pandoraea TaxID=93217 RepID=UPI001F5CE88A|nr:MULTISPECIES: hypothetical protein [Pandoraea]